MLYKRTAAPYNLLHFHLSFIFFFFFLFFFLLVSIHQPSAAHTLLFHCDGSVWLSFFNATLLFCCFSIQLRATTAIRSSLIHGLLLFFCWFFFLPNKKKKNWVGTRNDLFVVFFFFFAPKCGPHTRTRIFRSLGRLPSFTGLTGWAGAAVALAVCGLIYWIPCVCVCVWWNKIE